MGINDRKHKKIVITNRHLCTIPLIQQLERIISQIDIVILREKDMTSEDYTILAKDVIELCSEHDKQCILHSFIDVAGTLDHRQIQLPLNILRENAGRLDDSWLIGASVHSVTEAEEAIDMSADYLIASHIFETDCKAGLAPKGPRLLQDIRRITGLPLYALGGINDENEHMALENGADGTCRMSWYMKYCG
jgi:thiamine-phosphate pyrophosphorylase